MSTIKALKRPRMLIMPLALTLLAVGLVIFPQLDPPQPQSQTLSFSIGASDPRTATGVHPADILGIGAMPLIACDRFGLICTDPATGAQDDLISLSYGQDFIEIGFPPMQFSVAAGSAGLAGTAVRLESECRPSEPQSDVFETGLASSNTQDLDGNGLACSANDGFGLLLSEGDAYDNVDALDRDPCMFVDPNCDGVPEEPIFFTLAAYSPSLATLGATPADILVSGIDFTPLVWASGTNDLGLKLNDVIDAICIREDGDGRYGSGDQLLFSLAPGSPSLSLIRANAADLLRAQPVRIGVLASQLGLAAADNLDALMCSSELHFHDLFLPVVRK
jgi:hypothetical protein